jgi:hypothetical protein
MFFEAMDQSWQRLLEPRKDLLERIEQELSKLQNLTPKILTQLKGLLVA